MLLEANPMRKGIGLSELSAENALVVMAGLSVKQTKRITAIRFILPPCLSSTSRSSEQLEIARPRFRRGNQPENRPNRQWGQVKTAWTRDCGRLFISALVIPGEKDNCSQSEAYAKLVPNCGELSNIRPAGRSAIVEKLEKVGKLVIDFLGDVAKAF